MKVTKKTIRPILNLSASSEKECFQNEVLRPILKLQHDIIIALFTFYIEKHNINVVDLDSTNDESEISTVIKKNTVLRNQLLGTVIGQMVLEEFLIYKKEERAYNKRILNMIGKRIFDSFQ